MLQRSLAAQCGQLPSERRGKVLLVNSSSFAGGAGKAALRLYRALQDAGRYDLAWMSASPHPAVDNTVSPEVDGDLLSHFFRRVRDIRQRSLRCLRPTWRAGAELRFDYGSSFNPADIRRSVPACDVVNLHWTTGLLDPETVAWIATNRAPVVWTLHDMAPLTGGCHFDGGCGGFAEGCRQCPQLSRMTSFGYAARRLRLKRDQYERIPEGRLHIVSPSRWLALQAQRSPHFRDRPVHVIPNAINLDVFRPRNRDAARRLHGIPADCPVILFLAEKIANRRKGGHLLEPIVARIRETVPDIVVMVVGSGSDSREMRFDHRSLGAIRDENQLAEIYSMADVVLLPSSQDNLPNIMAESMACGVPVAAFGVGGIPDMVISGRTGVLAAAGDVDGLASAVISLLDDAGFRARAPGYCRQMADEKCNPERQSQRYSDLYDRVMAACSGP